MLRGKDDVTHLSILAPRGAPAVQLLEHNRLAIQVLVALDFGLAFAVRNQFGQVRGWIFGAERGREECEC